MRFFPVVMLVGALILPTGVAAMEAGEEEGGEIDTDHLFAFSTGTDIGEVGTKELESEATFGFGKRSGRYLAYTQEESFGYIPGKNLHTFASGALGYWDINNVPGLDDRNQAAFGELSLEARYRLMNRENSPFGLALQVNPHWAPRDETSGEPVTSYGAAFAVLADKEIVKGRVVSVVNVVYEPEGTREQGSWEKESNLEISAAVLALWPHHVFGLNLFVGVGAQHLETYEGLGLDNMAGQATFVGPNICFHNHDQSLWIIGGWSTQVGGRANNADGLSDSSLDLVNYNRQVARLTVGFSF